MARMDRQQEFVPSYDHRGNETSGSCRPGSRTSWDAEVRWPSPRRVLEGAFAEGIGFDGSVIEGFLPAFEGDMFRQTRPSTFQILPWRVNPGTARMFCDIMFRMAAEHRRTCGTSPQRTLAKCRKWLHVLRIPEIEFFLL